MVFAIRSRIMPAPRFEILNVSIPLRLHIFNGFDVVTYTGHHLTAVSPVPPPCQDGGLPNDNISDPLLRQFQRGIDA